MIVISFLMSFEKTNLLYKKRIDLNVAFFGFVKFTKQFQIGYYAFRDFLFLTGGLMSFIYWYILKII